LLVLGFGLGLPSGDYNPGLEDSPENEAARLADVEDNFWRFIYIFPMMINIFMLVSFLYFIRCEPIMFSLSHGDEDHAFELIDKVYCDSEDKQQILEVLKDQCHRK